MTQAIFYSWQIDLPEDVNKSFIQRCLETAARNIRSDESLRIQPVVDRDASNAPGSPDIAQTIDTKIQAADLFVADVSIINSRTRQRKTPNPNVLLELGFAKGVLALDKCILVMNAAYGNPETLPFDLRGKKALTYLLRPDDTDTHRASAEAKLCLDLEKVIRLILGEAEKRRSRVSKETIEYFKLEDDPYFKRHIRAKIGAFSLANELGFLQMHSIPTKALTLPAGRLDSTFLDRRMTYSRIINESTHAPEYHSEGVTRHVDVAQVTCYDDGHVVTESYIDWVALVVRDSKEREDRHSLNPVWIAYEIQRHLQLSKEVLEGLQDLIVFALRLEGLGKIKWATYYLSRVDSLYPYKGYHRDLVRSIALEEIHGRDRWNEAIPHLESMMNELARMFGLKEAPQQYVNESGNLYFADGRPRR